MASSVLASVANALGLTQDLLRSALLLFGNYLLVPPFMALATPASRHLFSIVAASLSFVMLFSASGYLQIVLLSFVCFNISREARGALWGPVAVFVLAMGVVCANHIYTQWIAHNDSRMDHTAPMMVLVMKLTSYAWSEHDGFAKEDTLTEHQRKHAIREHPSLLSFFGYVHFFPSFLVGPTFSFKDYDDFIERRGVFANIPPTFRPAMECLGSAFIPLYITLFWAPHYNHWKLIDPTFIASHTMIQTLVFIQIGGVVARCMFYTGWKLSEGACVFTGLGYNGQHKDGYHLWNRTENCDMLKVELAENPRAQLSQWNKNTAVWLREDVYIRLERAKFSSSTATMVTFVVSAFWHGVHAGFYFAFVFLSILTTVARHMRRNVRPWFSTPESQLSQFKFVYDFLGALCTQLAINYVMAPFVIHTVLNTYIAYSPVYFIGHIILVALYVGFESKVLSTITRRIGVTLGANYDVSPKKRHSNGSSKSSLHSHEHRKEE